jgi:hypothetical protein
LITNPPATQQATADSGQAGNVMSGGIVSGGAANDPGCQDPWHTVSGNSSGSTGNEALPIWRGGTTWPHSWSESGGHASEFGLPEYRDPWETAVTSNTLGFSEAGNHPGSGWVADDGGHAAQLALLNQFAMTHFTSAYSDNGGAPISDSLASVNPIATIAHHHP